MGSVSVPMLTSCSITRCRSRTRCGRCAQPSQGTAPTASPSTWRHREDTGARAARRDAGPLLPAVVDSMSIGVEMPRDRAFAPWLARPRRGPQRTFPNRGSPSRIPSPSGRDHRPAAHMAEHAAVHAASGCRPAPVPGRSGGRRPSSATPTPGKKRQQRLVVTRRLVPLLLAAPTGGAMRRGRPVVEVRRPSWSRVR